MEGGLGLGQAQVVEGALENGVLEADTEAFEDAGHTPQAFGVCDVVS
jgi:hypothetical protein